MNVNSPSALPTVLVVDDEPMIRQLIGCFLRSRNLAVIEAGNGEEALQLLEAKAVSPDLVIADLVMPGMGGLALLENLRRDKADLAALIVSGFYEDPSALEKAMNERTHFLGKPFNFKILEVEVNRLLPAKSGAR